MIQKISFGRLYPKKFYSNSPSVISGSLQKKLNLRIMALSEALDQFALSDNHVRNCIDLIKSDDVQKVSFLIFSNDFKISKKQFNKSRLVSFGVHKCQHTDQRRAKGFLKVGFAEPWSKHVWYSENDIRNI